MVVDENSSGFIGKHLKKLREQEIAKEQAVKAINEDTQEFGSPLPETAYVDKIKNHKKGILARAREKAIKEE